MAEDAPTTRKCGECGGWYDARSSACYLCGEEDRQVNAALVKAVETTRLNSALARQTGFAQAEGRVEQMARRNQREGTAAALPTPGYSKVFSAAQEYAAAALNIDH